MKQFNLFWSELLMLWLQCRLAKSSFSSCTDLVLKRCCLLGGHRCDRMCKTSLRMNFAWRGWIASQTSWPPQHRLTSHGSCWSGWGCSCGEPGSSSVRLRRKSGPESPQWQIGGGWMNSGAKKNLLSLLTFFRFEALDYVLPKIGQCRPCGAKILIFRE